MKARKNTGIKIVCNNRKARFNYFFQELIEAGNWSAAFDKGWFGSG